MERTASVPRGAAKLFMSKTAPSPPINFYSDFQNPKLNTRSLHCTTASTENPVDTAKCVCMCTCAIHLKDTSIREILIRFAFFKALAISRRNAGCWFYNIILLYGVKETWHQSVKSWKVYKGMIPQLVATAAVLRHTDWCTSCLINRFYF